MRFPHRGYRLLAVALAALFLAPVVHVEAQGRLVTFEIQRFDDTLFVAIDAVHRVAFDDRGHLWYTTQGGVVHVDVANHTRNLYTRSEGLPSSFSLGLAIHGGKVYAGTDLGLAIIDIATGRVVSKTQANSQIPDAIVQDIAVDGDHLWIGTYFGGVARYNPATDQWVTKNTSTTSDYAKPVRRILPTQDAVWVATDGDGLWRYDRASQQWSVLLKEDGLVTNDVRAVLYAGQNLYIGTEEGMQVRRNYAPYAGTPDEWVIFNKTNAGLPDNLVLDLDVIPVAGGGTDIFAATRKGIWQYDGDTGSYAVLDQSYGILGSSVLDNVWGPHGWAIATTRGVSLQRGGEWTYYVTGPSDPRVASQGPGHFMFTSASVGDSGPVLWFGTPSGITAYRPASGDSPGVWYNRAEWSNYTGGPVNWIDTHGDITWVGSNSGVYGFRHSTQEWFERKVINSRNLVYGLEADRGELWIGLFGDGLIMRNLTTGASRSWDALSSPPIPDVFITDVRAQGNDIWIGSRSGVTRLDRVSGTFTATYTTAEGLPGNGIVYRLLPEGNTIWVATKDAGVARLDLNEGRVIQTWSAASHPGFPDGEVRSLHRAGEFLFVGTTDGLARIHIGTGGFKAYRTTDSDLVQNYVNGITSRDGIVYLATLSGVARLDLATDTFLPMHEGEKVQPRRGDAPRAPLAPSVRVTIASPSHLDLVSGLVRVTGTAAGTGGASVDRVEVQVDEGAWQTAEGTGSWTYTWDSTSFPADRTVTLRARALSGANMSRIAEILVIPIEAPQTPLLVEALAPPNATAGRDLVIAARASGDPPLSVSVQYRANGSSTYSRAEMTQDGSVWRATIPASAVKVGDLQFYLEARSGRHVQTDPADVGQPYVLRVEPAPLLAVALSAPSEILATAGQSKAVPLVLRNTGTEPVSVKLELEVEGPAARWLRLPDQTYDLAAGQELHVDAVADVEAAATTQERRVIVAARDVTGAADPARTEFRLRVQAAEAAPASTNTTTPTDEGGGFRIPAPGAFAALAVAAAAALVLRRRDSR